MPSLAGQIGALDESPLFNIVTWILGVTILLLVSIKIGLAYASFGLHADDWSILVATVAAVFQTVFVTLQSYNGLGRPQESLSKALVEKFEWTSYVAEFFHITSMGASKLCILFLIFFLTRNMLRRIFAVSVGIFIILWSVASLFVTAFQCSNPHPWSMITGTCTLKIPFWTSYAVINMVTEVLLIALPAEIIYNTKIEQKTKSILIFCFTIRLIVIAAIAGQMYCLWSSKHNPYMMTRSDMTFHSWPFMLSTEIVQALSIITVCIPFLKPLLAGLETGMLQTGRIRLRRRARAKTIRASRTEKTSSKYPSEVLGLMDAEIDAEGDLDVPPEAAHVEKTDTVINEEVVGDHRRRAREDSEVIVVRLWHYYVTLEQSLSRTASLTSSSTADSLKD